MHAIYLNHYLSDKDVANFARQSFAKLAENFTEEQNNSLIRFLARGMSSGDWETLIESTLPSTYAADREARHALAVYLRKIPEHFVPFCHPHISLRMQAPVPIARQCYRHKIGYVESEESRRYIRSRPEFFLPEHFRKAAENAKQGSGAVHLTSDVWKDEYERHCTQGIELYDRMISAGICPEQARFVLPQGCEVNWVWTGSLYAFANFYNQRSDSHAQKEIQDLAKEVGDIIAPLFPVSWKALTAGEY